MTHNNMSETLKNDAMELMNCVNINAAFHDSFEELINEVPSTPLPWWPRLNEFLGGLRPFEYTILCGSTGLGKTTFLANLSGQLMQQCVKHFVASVETGHKDYARRLMSLFCKEDLNRGDIYNKEKLIELKKIISPVFQLSQNNLFLSRYNNRISLDVLLRDLRYAHNHLGCEIAFLDNLNFFMEITSAQNAVIEMDRVTHELIMLTKQIPMHIVMVMHPRKTEDSRVESEFDIKGSSTAVQEAQNILLLNRMTDSWLKMNEIAIKRKEIIPSQFRELKIAKLRKRGYNTHKRVVFRCDETTRYHEFKNQENF